MWRVSLSASEQKALRLFGAAVRRERPALGMTQKLLTTVQRIQITLGSTWESLMG